MRPSDEQREQAVELLRCCADRCEWHYGAGLYDTALMLGHATWDCEPWGDATVWRLATDARNAVHAGGLWFGYGHECLEAAQRIEDGLCP
jgi:hypothetical protein